ncbi:MAG: glycoside hydrolase family 2 TIM barrel-domain containing protein [Cryomorphaceae bacterium]
MKKFAVLFVMVLLAACSSEPNPVVVEQSVPAEYFKAICYHPVNVGNTQRSWEFIDQDLDLMQEAGISVIRVYMPITDENVLNKLAERGMKVITSFGYNQDSVYDLYSGTYLEYVTKYKNHPAIYLWELGNEYNYHPEWFDGDLMNWYTTLEKAVDAIHAEDSTHLVTTAHGEVPDSTAMHYGRHLDMWGFNVYRWDLPASFVAEWRSKSDKPFYFSELGADSYMTIEKDSLEQGVNERAQAVAVSHIIDELEPYAHEFEGMTLFSFTDGWWKAGNPEIQDIGGWAPNSSGVPYDGSPNEEFWGIVNIDRTKKEVFAAVRDRFKKE